MNIIILVLTLVVTINAIRVPTVWPDEDSEFKHPKPFRYGSYHRRISVNNKEDYRIYPPTRLQKISKLPYEVQHFNSKPKKYYKKYKPTDSVWTPIIPYVHKKHLQPKKLNKNLKQYPKTRYLSASSEYVTSRSFPLYKNYRDHEDANEKISEPSPEIDRPSLVEIEHEHPEDIPTVPVYPGEGQWAKPGIKHKPFISKQKYSQLPEDSSEKPEGYEILLKGKSLYDKKHKKFDKTQNDKHLNTETKEEQNKDVESEEEEEEGEEGFVPSTMYVQVRKTENEEHLPTDAEGSEDGRLKEVIKDSKILTVYTEEGYEDSAYDHAGHEKEAEDSQGYKEYKKDEERERHPEAKQQDHEDQNEDESSKVYSTIRKPNKTYTILTPIRNNKLHKTESTKTVYVKDEPDEAKMKITSEMKTITNPDNGKVETSTKNLHIPMDEPKYIKSKNSSADSSNTPKTRKKRFANDFPSIDVKTDFINGVIREDKKIYYTKKADSKYPYYNSEHINPNSPLKYAENMDNIPKKTEGRMAFYEAANKIQCPEIEEDIAAIPERIENVEKSVNEGVKLEDSEESGKSPRLGKLGQRIDCFKRKYFGENPLDSPFFKEEKIEPVAPLFKVLQERSAGFQANHIKSNEHTAEDWRRKKYHGKFSSRIKASPPFHRKQNVNEVTSDEIGHNVRINDDLKDARSNFDSSYENVESSPEVEVINVDTFKSINGFTSEAPSVSLVTTPRYSVNITPKNIYDQIKLLDFFPSTTPSSTVIITESSRKGKTAEEVTEASELRMRPNYQNYTPRRPQRIKKKRPHFDVDSFVQATSRRVTKTPNSYRTENVIYNENYEQSPLDQMNVFSDVLNNIRNGSNDPLKVAATTYNTPNQYQNSIIRMRVPPKRIHMKIPESIKSPDVRKSYYRTTTIPTTLSPSTTKSKRGSIRYVTTEKVTYDDYEDYDEQPKNDKKNIMLNSVTTVPPESIAEEDIDTEVSGSHTTETIYEGTVQNVADIIGLVPPSRYHYRTIYQPVDDLLKEPIVSESQVVNNYHVLGMKPPSTQQKVYDYSDFHRIFTSKNANNHKYLNHRRGKRSPNRKSYFEVVRGQNSENDQPKKQEEEDDYVPHRSKNWYWDEKLKKIVYNKPKEDENSDAEDEEDEEVVEVEVKETTPRNIKQTTTRRSFTNTTPLNGPSYVDFVKLLRSKKEYVSIPDPTTTKGGIEMETTTSNTPISTNPTKPPEFLSFISKLRQSDSYKLIEEKNKTVTTTTTTELPESEEKEEIEDADTTLSNVQNSPGRGAVDIGQNLQIFDVNDFLPKVKTYSPRTEIDYSKYKTIQRPRVQTTTETIEKKDAGDSDREEGFKIEVQNAESSTEGKLEIFELSRPTTTSTSTTTTTISTTIQKRRRRPTTTQRSTSSSTTISKNDAVPAAFSKPKRVYPRRRTTHIRTRTTTPKSVDDALPQESRKAISRRHNSVERNPKIVSLESIIQRDSPKNEGHSSISKSSEKVDGHTPVTVDDVLKNINRLKEVNIEETIPDYTLESRNEEEDDSKDQNYDDDNTKISLNDGGITNKKLVISKDKQQGMIYYTSVR